MSLVFSESQRPDAGGVTLAQLAEATERALRECSEQNINPATVEPKVMVRIGGKIKKIDIAV